MLLLNRRQRTLLADKLIDVSNVAAGALIFGQFLGDRPFSLWLAISGSAVWLFLIACGVALEGGTES